MYLNYETDIYVSSNTNTNNDNEFRDEEMITLTIQLSNDFKICISNQKWLSLFYVIIQDLVLISLSSKNKNALPSE